jgi:spermidine synthase
MSIAIPAKPHPASVLAAPVFTATIFLSASLLFFVQPLFTKIVLPHIGGTPAVWTTAMLFFQSVLIAGYAYAHFSTKYLSVKAQMILHLSLWAAALAFLPLTISQGWSYDAASSTVLQTLSLFALGVGVPFAVLSANAPLIQSWYSKSGGPSADDPYFLYGASNFGSLLALLAFPLVAEPLFGASAIGAGWAAGFVALGGFLLLSGLFAWRNGRPAHVPAHVTHVDHKDPAKPVTAAQIGTWLLLAFIPSSLMLAVTTKISTDIGSFPLIWAIPLALYLLTFVMTFTRRPWINDHFVQLFFTVGLLALIFLITISTKFALSWTTAAALVTGFFAVALMSHRKLYLARPDGRQLTVFYVTMSVGGALGGLFNSIIAPIVFDGLHEGRFVLVLAGLLFLPALILPKPRDLAVGALAGAVCLLVFGFGLETGDETTGNLAPSVIAVALLAGIWAFRERGYALFAMLCVVLGASPFLFTKPVLHEDRSFFGTHRVFEEDTVRKYSNGTTLHGAQRIQDDGRKPLPLSYYHPNGPMGQIMASDQGQSAQSVGVVGLGVGSLACYRQPHQTWAFYEIDKLVDDIARTPEYFSFLSQCAPDAPTHLGDARIVLEQQNDVKYDILVIDAYSSDAVPVHLSTVEAIALYMERLNPGGLLVFHISNRYYSIDKPLGRGAKVLGLAARIQTYRLGENADVGETGSTVVVMSQTDAPLAALADDDRWQVLGSDGGRVWTDDFTNLMAILR